MTAASILRAPTDNLEPRNLDYEIRFVALQVSECQSLR